MLRGQRGMRSRQIKNTKGQQGWRLNRKAEIDFIIYYIVKGGVAGFLSAWVLTKKHRKKIETEMLESQTTATDNGEAGT